MIVCVRAYGAAVIRLCARGYKWTRVSYIIVRLAVVTFHCAPPVQKPDAKPSVRLYYGYGTRVCGRVISSTDGRALHFMPKDECESEVR